MIRHISLLPAVLLGLFIAACGDDKPPPPLYYTNPPAGGQLRLVKNTKETLPTIVALDLIVGDQALTGYSTGFNLPLDATKVVLGTFTPGTALDPGADPIAARAVLPESGPLANVLVTAQSQKADGNGAVPTDTTLAPKTVLFTVYLSMNASAEPGVVFDGTAADFVLPSGGMRDRAGTTVVEPANVKIGKLQVTGSQ